MVRVEWAAPAVEDLEGVYEYIARDSPRYARNTVERITESAARLARFPQLGQVVPEYPQSMYRQLAVGNYRLIYREDHSSNRVIVMGIIHGSRDLPTAFGKRREGG